MSKFAAGKKAFGISDRSGFRYPLHRMRKEWTGMIVGYDEFEPKQPQLHPRKKVSDPQALKNPRPDRIEPLDVYVGVKIVEINPFVELKSFGQVGSVTVEV
ncbi:MAG TPA: hypothetical protein DCM40_20325 [Maribacter sp.]|jgi:hypothetical protein|nr:hypothetical protein [Maribacter sp.]|tara:strand:- start:669 stop:971 length:303 start_codon:yes stop_codon:yes gene_type:complete